MNESTCVLIVFYPLGIVGKEIVVVRWWCPQSTRRGWLNMSEQQMDMAALQQIFSTHTYTRTHHSFTCCSDGILFCNMHITRIQVKVINASSSPSSVTKKNSPMEWVTQYKVTRMTILQLAASAGAPNASFRRQTRDLSLDITCICMYVCVYCIVY